jgi:hypothetical protein
MKTIHESDLGRLVELGHGGMARVFSVPELILSEEPEAKWVYKRYKAKIRPVPVYGLQGLVRLLDRLPHEHRRVMQRHFNWPVRVVTDGSDGSDGSSGVILSLLPDAFFFDLHLSSGRIKRKPTEMQYFLQDQDYCSRTRVPALTLSERRSMCRSLVYAMALLDRLDVVYGDLSARNVLFRIGPRPGVTLVDCDSVRARGSAAAVGKQPHSPDWEPPEALRALRRRDSTAFTIQNKETDRYKLGLAILRILTPGQGCATSVDPSRARQCLPRNLYELLVSSLKSEPANRPAAAAWYEEMKRER